VGAEPWQRMYALRNCRYKGLEQQQWTECWLAMVPEQHWGTCLGRPAGFVNWCKYGIRPDVKRSGTAGVLELCQYAIGPKRCWHPEAYGGGLGDHWLRTATKATDAGTITAAGSRNVNPSSL